MFSIFVRNLLFTILQPGLVVGFLPIWIADIRIDSITDKTWQLNHYLGTIIFLIGFVIMLKCIVSFAVKGRGTLSPADPTKRLVVVGLYKFSRNPMYVGVVLMLVGEAIFFQSIELWVYSLFVFLGFNIFAILVEEPRLRRDFGEEYKGYCEKVGRWF